MAEYAWSEARAHMASLITVRTGESRTEHKRRTSRADLLQKLHVSNFQTNGNDCEETESLHSIKQLYATGYVPNGQDS